MALEFCPLLYSTYVYLIQPMWLFSSFFFASLIMIFLLHSALGHDITSSTIELPSMSVINLERHKDRESFRLFVIVSGRLVIDSRFNRNSNPIRTRSSFWPLPAFTATQTCSRTCWRSECSSSRKSSIRTCPR